jgi:nicotinamidase/pyrazinamidase
MSRALIIVDVQNDFLPGGALGVDGGDEIVEPIVELSKTADLIVVTRDWHPQENPEHFEKWPVHCVQGTPGADFHPAINDLPAWLITKGDSGADDGYSGFEGRTAGGELLAKVLREQDVTEVTVVGLALDYCVKATALDALREGFDVTVPLELTRPVDDATGTKALIELEDAGVKVVDTYRTKSGRVLTDEDIERLADEAEAGYDVDEILGRRES